MMFLLIALQASLLPLLLHYVRNLAIWRNKDVIDSCLYCIANRNTIVAQQEIQTFREHKEPEKS